MSDVYKTISHTTHDEPFICLVQQMRDVESLKVFAKHQEEFMAILKVNTSKIFTFALLKYTVKTRYSEHPFR